MEYQVSSKVLHTFKSMLSGTGHYPETEIIFAISYNLQLGNITQNLVLFLACTYLTNALILLANFHLAGLQRLFKKVKNFFKFNATFQLSGLLC